LWANTDPIVRHVIAVEERITRTQLVRFIAKIVVERAIHDKDHLTATTGKALLATPRLGLKEPCFNLTVGRKEREDLYCRIIKAEAHPIGGPYNLSNLLIVLTLEEVGHLHAEKLCKLTQICYRDIHLVTLEPTKK